ARRRSRRCSRASAPPASRGSRRRYRSTSRCSPATHSAAATTTPLPSPAGPRGADVAHVPLTPIGRALGAVLDPATQREHRSQLEAREGVLGERRAAIQQGWGAEYAARVHKKGKLTARERL